MADPTNITKLCLQSLGIMQEELHRPRDEQDEKGNVIPGALESIFGYNFVPISWSAQVVAKLKSEESGDECIYTVANKFHFLLYTYLRVQLPAITIKKKYQKTHQICWTHNLGHNIIEHGYLCFDDMACQTYDNIWLDIYSQFYMKNKSGAREHYDLMIGNVSCLEEWSSSLPRYTLNCPQPWFYSRSTVTAIPLYLCSMSTVTHKYKFRRRFSELLRLRTRREIEKTTYHIDGNGEEHEKKTISGYTDWAVKSHSYIKHISKYIKSSIKDIPVPEMFGKYSQISTDELRHRAVSNRFDEVKPDKSEFQPIEIYTEDIISFNTDNPKGYGRVPMVVNCDSPCKAMFWVASNTKSVRRHNFSNYTTDMDDRMGGWSPSDNLRITFGTSSKTYIDIPHDESAMTEPWYGQNMSTPSEPGYNCKSFAYDSTSLNGDIALIPNKLSMKLIFNLANTDIYAARVNLDTSDIDDYTDNQSDASDNSNSDFSESEFSRRVTNQRDTDTSKYHIHVRFLAIQKLVFNGDGSVQILNDWSSSSLPTTTS